MMGSCCASALSEKACAISRRMRAWSASLASAEGGRRQVSVSFSDGFEQGMVGGTRTDDVVGRAEFVELGVLPDPAGPRLRAVDVCLDRR